MFWYSIALFGKFDGGKIEWIMVIFPIGHVAVGLGLTYDVLAGFLNKTTVRRAAVVRFAATNLNSAVACNSV